MKDLYHDNANGWANNKNEVNKEEQAIYFSMACSLMRYLPPDFTLFFLGCGTANAELVLLQLLSQVIRNIMVMFVDLSKESLEIAKEKVVFYELPFISCFIITDFIKNSIFTKGKKQLITLLGNTFGNLNNEEELIKHLTKHTSIGDLLLFDFSIWSEPAYSPIMTDPRLNGTVDERLKEFYEKWAKNTYGQDCTIGYFLSMNRKLPGSYTVEMHVNGVSVIQWNKYIKISLIEWLLKNSWRTLTFIPYMSNTRALILVERI